MPYKPIRCETLHTDSDGISPYLQCPWCGYADVCGEFMPYGHPKDPSNHPERGSTQCGQCEAAGWSIYFLLAYDPHHPLHPDDEKFRETAWSWLRVMNVEGIPEEKE